MRRYSFAFLRNYLSTMGIELSREGTYYTATNGASSRTFYNLTQVTAFAAGGGNWRE